MKIEDCLYQTKIAIRPNALLMVLDQSFYFLLKGGRDVFYLSKQTQNALLF